MAITKNVYNQFTELVGDGTIDLDGDTFKMALCSALTFTAANTLWSEVSSTDLGTANGYTAAGQALTSVTWSQTSGTATFDSADVSWTATGGSIAATDAVLYDDTVVSPADALMFNYDFGGTETAVDTTNFVIQAPASGWFTAVTA